MACSRRPASEAQGSRLSNSPQFRSRSPHACATRRLALCVCEESWCCPSVPHLGDVKAQACRRRHPGGGLGPRLHYYAPEHGASKAGTRTAPASERLWVGWGGGGRRRGPGRLGHSASAPRHSRLAPYASLFHGICWLCAAWACAQPLFTERGCVSALSLLGIHRLRLRPRCLATACERCSLARLLAALRCGRRLHGLF